MAHKPKSERTHLVAIAGSYRSGTSCVAGVLNSLGLEFGDSLLSGSRDNEKGYFEPRGLQQEIQRAFDEARGVARVPRRELVQALRRWFIGVRNQGQYVGLKLPLLCLMMETVDAAMRGAVKWIAVDRPMTQSATSLSRTNWGWLPKAKSPEACLPIIERMISERDAFLTSRDHQRVSYTELIRKPTGQVERLITHLSLNPTEEQFSAAVAFIDPNLWHMR